MIDSLYNAVFRCSHKRTSFPQRPATKPGAPPAEMYVVCLDCGKRFHYDWEQMRMGEQIAPPPPTHLTREDSARRGRSQKKVWFLAALSALPVIWLVRKANSNKSEKQD